MYKKTKRKIKYYGDDLLQRLGEWVQVRLTKTEI